jgi:hypothetical protein
VRTAALVLLLVAGCSGSSGAPFGGGEDSGAGGDGGRGADGGSDSGVGPDGRDTGQGTYSAHPIIGGLDRIVIFKADGARDVCFVIELVETAGLPSGLTLPQGWGLERAGAYHDAAACVRDYLGGAQLLAATAARGRVDWQGVGTPSAIDVAATLTFDNPPSWAPSSEPLAATALPVQ